MGRLRAENTCQIMAPAGASGPGKAPVSQRQAYWPLRARGPLAFALQVLKCQLFSHV